MESKGLLAGMRILVVEDNFFVAEDLCRLIGAALGAPTLAGTVEEALAALTNGPFEGAFIDVGLKSGTSIEIARQLQAKNIPFVIMTGYAREQLAPELRAAPYLAKPFGRQELISAATRYFGQATRAA